jgi:hypothetical protein
VKCVAGNVCDVSQYRPTGVTEETHEETSVRIPGSRVTKGMAQKIHDKHYLVGLFKIA